MLPLRLATFAKTVWNVVSERANPTVESVRRIDMSSANMMMRRNARVSKWKPSDFRSVVRILAMGPHLVESAHCRTSALRVKGMEQKRGQASLSPFLLPQYSDLGLLDGGKHFLNLWRFQLFERFRFNLANPFPRNREALSHLLQRTGLIVANTES